MTRERRKLGYQLNQDNAYSLEDTTPHLKTQRFDPEKEYFEFLINGGIRPEDLRALLTLPHEVALYGTDNRFILSTGTRKKASPEEDTVRSGFYADVSHHTHPCYEGETPCTTPSLGDARSSHWNKDSTILSVGHPDGLTIYRRPFLDPVTKELCDYGNSHSNEYILRMIEKFAALKRVWHWDMEIPGQSKNLYDKLFADMTKQEIIKFERQFAEETGMIVDEAKWEDKQGIERVVAKAFKGIQQ